MRSRRTRVAMRVAVAALAALCLSGTAEAATVVRAWFPQGDQLRYGIRAVDGRSPVLRTTVATLLAGPTRAEARDGARTAFARGTRLLGLRRQGSLVTIQLDRRFLQQTAAAPTAATPARLGLRILQLGRTLTQFQGVTRFRLSVSGRRLTTFPQLPMRWQPDADGSWDLRALAPSPAFPLSLTIRAEDARDPEQVRLAQTALAAAGWLDPSDVNGQVDYTTSQALTAFEAWNGLDRDGELTTTSFARALRAARPTPRHTEPGRTIEVYRDLGVVLLIQDGTVVRAVHTSTGFGGRTPAGSFHVYRKEQMSWSVPFQVWMPWASYFDAGFALHAYPVVPAYPASHGCVRLPAPEAQRVYAFAVMGTPVYVY